MTGANRENAPVCRRRFEPARLVLGLALMAVAAAHLLRASGRGDVPLPVLAALLPGALLLAAVGAVVAFTARRARDRSRAARAAHGPGGSRGAGGGGDGHGVDGGQADGSAGP
ncbi:hypothetical protein [Streptomyces specialis]|uniref:hypothetical protein n=1 Tax=Streptomyces specialis TaxID=498367 RepID=UPI00073E4283|nr:hypothetical protein [Streptomyces specialis]